MRLSFICLLIALSTPFQCAASEIWTITLLPGQSISGPAGSTIGWGYSITDNSAVDWLVLENLTESPLQDVSGTDPVFDFPILAPGQTVTESYVTGVSGLFGFTSSASAPNYFVNSANFVVSADWYNGDPFSSGSDLGAAATQSVAYTAQIVPGGVITPEPATWTLVCLGGLSVVWLKRRSCASADC